MHVAAYDDGMHKVATMIQTNRPHARLWKETHFVKLFLSAPTSNSEGFQNTDRCAPHHPFPTPGMGNPCAVLVPSADHRALGGGTCAVCEVHKALACDAHNLFLCASTVLWPADPPNRSTVAVLDDFLLNQWGHAALPAHLYAGGYCSATLFWEKDVSGCLMVHSTSSSR